MSKKEREHPEVQAPPSPGRMTRRQFVEGVAGIGVLAVLGTGTTALAGESTLMRPPGGQDESVLLGACIRCDRCRSVCPHRAIDVATIEDGLINVRTPKMNYVLGYCDTCVGAYKCIEACPTGALLPFDKETDRIGLAAIDFERCEAYGISARCKYECITVCPVSALSKDEYGRLVFDETACWGCGLCQYVCPSNAYRAYDGSSKRGINVEVQGGGSRG